MDFDSVLHRTRVIKDINIDINRMINENIDNINLNENMKYALARKLNRLDNSINRLMSELKLLAYEEGNEEVENLEKDEERRKSDIFINRIPASEKDTVVSIPEDNYLERLNNNSWENNIDKEQIINNIKKIGMEDLKVNDEIDSEISMNQISEEEMGNTVMIDRNEMMNHIRGIQSQDSEENDSPSMENQEDEEENLKKVMIDCQDSINKANDSIEEIERLLAANKKSVNENNDLEEKPYIRNVQKEDNNINLANEEEEFNLNSILPIDNYETKAQKTKIKPIKHTREEILKTKNIKVESFNRDYDPNRIQRLKNSRNNQNDHTAILSSDYISVKPSDDMDKTMAMSKEEFYSIVNKSLNNSKSRDYYDYYDDEDDDYDDEY